jgi:hypothetical protein
VKISGRHGSITLWLLAFLAFIEQPVYAGDIPGIPPTLLPQIERDFAFTFSNDFLGRGGSTDDFRTQQLDVVARLSDKWFLVVDQSILTLTDPPTRERVDQLAASVGYRLFDRESQRGIDTLAIGAGARSAGDFAGERIQNGFHRLVGSQIETLSYVDTESTDLTIWFDAHRYREVRRSDEWSLGYWLQARALTTSDGQWDGAASVAAVASRGILKLWLGVRRDWRTGYSIDDVQAATARAEDDAAIVLGVKFGALVFESVQQLNNDASYGQLSLVSSGFRTSNDNFAEPRGSIELGFLVPDVHVQLLGKLRSHWFTNADSVWHESVFLEVRYGEPQYGSDESLYVESLQVGAGLEWERYWNPSTRWISFYSAVGLGWRNEQLDLEDRTSSEQSEKVGSGVVTAATGLRFDMAILGRGWNYRFQLGLTAWAPLEGADVLLDGQQYSIQKPGVALVLGMSFDFSPGT